MQKKYILIDASKKITNLRDMKHCVIRMFLEIDSYVFKPENSITVLVSQPNSLNCMFFKILCFVKNFSERSLALRPKPHIGIAILKITFLNIYLD